MSERKSEKINWPIIIFTIAAILAYLLFREGYKQVPADSIENPMNKIEDGRHPVIFSESKDEYEEFLTINHK